MRKANKPHILKLCFYVVKHLFLCCFLFKKLLQNTYPEYFDKYVNFNAVLHDRNSVESTFFRNDIAGGCIFNVDYKSENGKYLVDIMSIDDIEENIDMEELKKDKVTNEANKQRWMDLLNRLRDDEQIIAIATLK